MILRKINWLLPVVLSSASFLCSATEHGNRVLIKVAKNKMSSGVVAESARSLTTILNKNDKRYDTIAKRYLLMLSVSARKSSHASNAMLACFGSTKIVGSIASYVGEITQGHTVPISPTITTRFVHGPTMYYYHNAHGWKPDSWRSSRMAPPVTEVGSRFFPPRKTMYKELVNQTSADLLADYFGLDTNYSGMIVGERFFIDRFPESHWSMDFGGKRPTTDSWSPRMPALPIPRFRSPIEAQRKPKELPAITKESGIIADNSGSQSQLPSNNRVGEIGVFIFDEIQAEQIDETHLT